MNEKEIIRKVIKKNLEDGKTNFIIMPMGRWGRETKEILNKEFGIQEQFCIDNCSYDMKEIYSVKNMPAPKQNSVFLNVVWDQHTEFFLRQEVCEKYPRAKIVDTFRYDEIERIFGETNKVHLDFLGVGFPKCGTTSLDGALRENKKIYLPPMKEIQFMWHINQDTHRIYKEYYQEKMIKDKIVGAIEPTYRIMPEYIFRYYGKDLKIIFFVRNPAHALYSFYKMAMCLFGGSNIQHIKKYENITPQTFDIWAKENKEAYRYSEYISNFLQYYPKEQIKIVISEELFGQTETQMEQIQEFIGLRCEDRVQYKEFPHSNKRNVVSKDSSMGLINKELVYFARELRKNNSAFLNSFYELKTRIEKVTMKEYKEEMLSSTYDYLMKYYKESISELEKISGRSLRGIWY